MPVSTTIFPTVGPTEGVPVFGGQGVGLRRSGCRSATAYALGLLIYSPFFGMGGGLERPLRKHVGDMFSGRGRVHGQLTASVRMLADVHHRKRVGNDAVRRPLFWYGRRTRKVVKKTCQRTLLTTGNSFLPNVVNFGPRATLARSFSHALSGK